MRLDFHVRPAPLLLRSIMVDQMKIWVEGQRLGGLPETVVKHPILAR